MKLENIGIRRKLLSAFVLVLGTTLLASSVSYYSFSNLSEKISHITHRSVPMMGQSMTVSQLAAELNSFIVLLIGSTSDAQRLQHLDSINKVLTKLRQLSTSDKNNINVFTSQKSKGNTEILQSLDVKSQKIAALDRAVKKRIALNKNLLDVTNSAVNAHYILDEEIVNIINEASLEYVALADKTFSKNSEIIDTMLNEHLQSMFNALRLKVKVAEISAGLINALNINTSQQYLDDAKIIQKDLTVMNLYRQKLITKHIAQQKNLDPALEYLNTIGSAEFSLFGNSGTVPEEVRRNKLIENVRVTEKTIYKSLDPAIDVGHAMIYMSGNNLNTSVKKTLPTLMTEGVNALIGLLQIRAEMNTLNGLLSRAPQLSETDELSKLRDQYNSSESIIGDLLISVSNEEGLQGLVDGIKNNILLAVGRDGAFSIKEEVIKNQNSIYALKADMEKINISFNDILTADVNKSKDEVEAASTQIDQLISQSRWQLAVISVASMIITFMVYWFVISRNLLTRLLSTISALRSLANGDNNVAVNCKGSDELGMLAYTVDIFRNNSVQAEALRKEQEVLAQQQRDKDDRLRKLEQEQHKNEMERSRLQAEEAHRQQIIANDLQERVDNLLSAVSAASRGDLTHPINTAGDDAAGQMGRALGDFFSELRNNMSHINDNADRMTKASESLTSLSINMKDIANSNSQNSQDATRLANDVGANVESVSDATDQMSSSIKEIAFSTSEAEHIASEAVSLAETTDATVRKLAESSERIGSVVKVITSIAEQTNLLALNATIEAARAGEAGKGFAVVANEVKELAKGTASATDQIELRISEIQDDTISAVDAIASISKTINKISSIQSKISASVQEQSSVTHEISGSVKNTASTTKAITEVIDGVANKASLSKVASGEINDAANDLTSMASQLQSLVARYTGDQKGQ